MNAETEPTDRHRIERDQEYLACRATPSMPGEHYIRIRVVHAGPFNGEDKAMVATVHRDRYGRELLDRRRLIRADQLHANPNRKGGYRLVRDADGTPAVAR